MDKETLTKRPQRTAQEKMVQGSAWMTMSNITSRLLGAIYIIPWFAWMGEHGTAANSLFSMGYNIYAMFLLISTAGIPAAIAKQTAHYNSLNEYKISKQLFIRALQLMAVFGVVVAGIMYLSAPWLADISGGGAELEPTIRSLSFAVLIIPCMSVIRGYFQGNQELMPYALSQIYEQVARVVYMLIATFIIMKVMKGDYLTAVTQSTFAAFIGAIASFVVLLWYLRKQKPLFDYLESHSADQLQVSVTQLLVEIVREAIPFIIVGSGITIFKLVDQVTFMRFMTGFTEYSQFQLVELFGIFNANPDKLTMVVIALATSLSASGLPLITEAVTLKDTRGLAKLVSDNLQLFLFVMLPATFGMIVLARPLYTLFYNPDALGTKVLIQASYVGLVMGLYMLVGAMLQGMYQNKDAMKYFGIGLLVKILIQYPCIRLFEVYGPLLATAIAFTVTCFLMVRRIQQISRFNFGLTARRGLLILILSLLMTLAAFITRQLLYLVLSPDRTFQSFVIAVVVAAVGAGLYVWLALKTRLADKLMGERVAVLRQKLHIK
ncbi:polysaccharide biosynthesis family protein [Enterococcus canis]|uniref:Polysaccharide biosynthesis family protein n=2 Tax=Enterococcus canis TaxID=214095 RepID=A0A1L8RDF1_9ENTE|nr:polysaccharide biosynthesis protein [Enterococcus canis]OJG17801.1 polysaccharide biosynthesis family protein [Enterococcus canis]